ncbi:DUF779 domain-containing protein [Nocardioides limicola]|uniref:DUF779 domain-containing protein n=1 Tax=Nocardioides limicola TaxID=2803368 RepID=UPI00193B78EF|nr:DUF779 domain-containing protein [Nocardioides sp. DJM-14]
MDPTDSTGGRATGSTTSRVDVSGEAAELLRRLTGTHGPVMFHQSGGCCDGSAPMCYPDGDFLVGPADVLLGHLPIGLDRPVPVWMSKAQFEYWQHTHLTIDVVPGRGAGFSLEAPEGVRFLTRSRLLTEEEYAAARAVPPTR